MHVVALGVHVHDAVWTFDAGVHSKCYQTYRGSRRFSGARHEMLGDVRTVLWFCNFFCAIFYFYFFCSHGGALL